MKLFDRIEALEDVPRIRRPSAIHTTDQIVGMAARNGWTVGITAEDLVGTQCRAVIVLSPHDDEWLRGEGYESVWYADSESASSYQKSMDFVPFGKYQAMAVSPMVSGRLDPPDICLIYLTLAPMILFINGLQYSGYRQLEWGCVGESS